MLAPEGGGWYGDSVSTAVVATPCTKVCVVDGESGLCLGCFRTLPEIAGWGRLSDDERRALMAALPARRSRIAPEKLW